MNLNYFSGQELPKYTSRADILCSEFATKTWVPFKTLYFVVLIIINTSIIIEAIKWFFLVSDDTGTKYRLCYPYIEKKYLCHETSYLLYMHLFINIFIYLTTSVAQII
jgi:hypothetical protein